jgi:hypothetical protein
MIGWQTGGPPLDEATRFVKCEKCAGYFDILDYAAVLDHEEAPPHPACDQVQ